MNWLTDYANVDIDWTLAPEDAVTLYLEWGNNNWHGEHAPVRSSADVAHYFVVDTWGEEPMVRLIRRNSQEAVELASLALPEHLREEWRREYGSLKGVFAPGDAVIGWLKKEMDASHP